jgi:hypothetical protein
MAKNDSMLGSIETPMPQTPAGYGTRTNSIMNIKKDLDVINNRPDVLQRPKT